MKTLLVTMVISLLVIAWTSAMLIISRRKRRDGCPESSCMCHNQFRSASPPADKPVLYQLDADSAKAVK